MQVAHKVIEANQLYRAGHLVREQRVAKTEQRVDRVGWGPFDPPGKGPLILIHNQFPKTLEVRRCPLPPCPESPQVECLQCGCLQSPVAALTLTRREVMLPGCESAQQAGQSPGL